MYLIYGGLTDILSRFPQNPLPMMRPAPVKKSCITNHLN